MRRYLMSLLGASLLLAGWTAGSKAQTIDVPLVTIYTNGGFGQGGNLPSVQPSGVDPDLTNELPPYYRRFHGPQPGAWGEFVVNAETAGWYNIDMDMKQPSDAHTVMAFETRPFPENNYDTWYGTVDTKDYRQIAAYTATGPLVDKNDNVITVPLRTGLNILRMYNTTGRRWPVTAGYPADLTVRANRSFDGSYIWSNEQIAHMTLNWVAPLPEMGTITGKVTGDAIPGYGVKMAIVAANPQGQSPTELSWFWRNGWFTHTEDDGTYTLQYPLTDQPVDVKAGRPSSYQVQGVIGSTPSVSTATPPVDIVLPTLWKKNTADEWTVNLQTEYADSRSGAMAITLLDGAQNSYKVGYTNAGEYVNMLVDVPETGWYEVNTVFTNGGTSGGVVRIYTDYGSSTQDTHQYTGGWPTPGEKTYANPIFLMIGVQQLTHLLVSGSSDFDGINLRQLKSVPISIGQVFGVVTNELDGLPLRNATVQFVDGATVTTKADGTFNALVPARELPYTVNVTIANAERTYSGTITIAAGTEQELNVSIPVRVPSSLATLNGRVWKVIPNTGSEADFSALEADESGFYLFHNPMNLAFRRWNIPHDQYHWYRLRFDAPTEFRKVPGRLMRIRLTPPAAGNTLVDDVDAMWLNGQKIGQTGGFPSFAMPSQAEDYLNPPAGGRTTFYPGLEIANPQERLYYFPADLLKDTGNVLAVKTFQVNGNAGIMQPVYIEVAPATGVVTGTLLVDGAPKAGIRVAAMNTSNQTNDTALTDANGVFTLAKVLPGYTVIGAAGLNVNPVTATVSVSAGSNYTINLSTTSVDLATMYDDFTATADTDVTWWDNLWDRVSLEPNTEVGYPKIYEPGYVAYIYPIDPALDTPIPGSVTIESGTNNRTGLLSADDKRISRYASVSAARLVSAIAPSGTGSQPNVILRLVGYVPGTALTAYGTNHFIEIDIEGTNMMQTAPELSAEQRIFYRIFAHPIGLLTQSTLDGYSTLADVTPENPLDFAIVRLGSFYEFYLNGLLLHTVTSPSSLTVDHRIFLYSYAKNQLHTWDWVKAGPTAYTVPGPKGDLTGDYAVNSADVTKALRIWAGIDTSTSSDMSTGDVVTDPGISILDAARIQQAVNGSPF